MLCNNKQAFTLIVAHVVLLKVVFISALCMGNSCRIGKVVQLLGHGSAVGLLIGPRALKRLRTPELKSVF